MPKASHHNAIARQWEILKQLPSRPQGITARDVTEGLRFDGLVADKRTVECDLTELFPVSFLVR